VDRTTNLILIVKSSPEWTRRARAMATGEELLDDFLEAFRLDSDEIPALRAMRVIGLVKNVDWSDALRCIQRLDLDYINA